MMRRLIGQSVGQILMWMVLITFATAHRSFSSSDSARLPEEADIPQTTSAPPPLARKAIPKVHTCQRQIVYRGQVLNCDSHLHWDGERLRPILQNVPEAISELDIYQKNRRKVQTLAYTSTLGLILIGAGIFLGRNLASADRLAIRNVLAGTGAGITAGSVIYGFTLIRTNEEHLSNSVNIYNDKNPKDPIELKFTTGISF